MVEERRKKGVGNHYIYINNDDWNEHTVWEHGEHELDYLLVKMD